MAKGKLLVFNLWLIFGLLFPGLVCLPKAGGSSCAECRTKKVKCDLTPVTPRASTSQGLPESRVVNPVHTSLELRHTELKVNQELLALAEDSLTMSEQRLEVDCAMVGVVCELRG